MLQYFSKHNSSVTFMHLVDLWPEEAQGGIKMGILAQIQYSLFSLALCTTLLIVHLSY